MSTFDDLPIDLVVSIWSFLPVKTLLRLKSVQKSWNDLMNTLVKDRNFIADQLINGSNTSSYSTFVLEFLEVSDLSFEKKQRLLTLDHSNDQKANNVLHRLSRSEQGLFEYLSIGSHCNGIVSLFHSNSGVVVLCNPVTEELRLLPEPFYTIRGTPCCLRMSGFGYDAIDKLYKVVGIFGSDEHIQAKVYTLRNDEATSAWREIEIPMRIEGYHGKTDVSREGVSYWLADVRTEGSFLSETMILSFDLHDEIFETLGVPKNPNKYQRTLAKWRELVALFCTPAYCSSPIEVWVMSMDKCWTKYLSIPSIRDIRKPVAFWNNDEELLMVNTKGHLISYDIKKNKCRRIRCETLQRAVFISIVHSFVSPNLLS